ncbi:MAG TPA: peptidoglycan-binding domain-containing protein, partial [Dongiaceae bacterium]|nr:peptidoglycan-binding domain-containing protein [Dongiaceae bacterium]
PVAKIDGKAGMNTRALIGTYQKANNLKVDCWPTEALLAHVRAKAPAKGPAVKGANANAESPAATPGAKSQR